MYVLFVFVCFVVVVLFLGFFGGGGIVPSTVQSREYSFFKKLISIEI